MPLQEASHYRAITDAATGNIEETLQTDVETKILEAANAGMSEIVYTLHHPQNTVTALAQAMRALGFDVVVGRRHLEISW